jgi:proteasome lid subunit RPN8/RPN11
MNPAAHTRDSAISGPRVRSLLLSSHAARCIRAEIANAHSREICGFLMGYDDGPDMHVHRVEPAENIYDDKDRFAISQEDYLAVLAGAGRNESMLGVYHLHFGPPHPSCDDIRNMALHSFVWLIVGLSPQANRLIQKWRCFQLIKGRVAHVRVGRLT